jgi:hypothetical protein
VENGGLLCEYVGRYWGQDDVEEERRLAAAANIKKSIDNGVPAVSWDIGVPEWGLITGYDDDAQMFSTLAINASHADPSSPAYDGAQMPYEALGKRELPILSVLTVTGASDKPQQEILGDTLKLAAEHLNGKEWCDNAKGLEAYPALIKHFEAEYNPDASWNMEYFLGTFGALKYYAWKYLEKSGQVRLTGIYKSVYDAWMESFRIKAGGCIGEPGAKEKIAELLRSAYENEKQAVDIILGKV